MPEASTWVRIYVLTDPTTEEARYVGKTIKRLQDRLRIHLWAARNGRRDHRSNWIRQLLSQGREPAIIEVDRISSHDDWAALERYWIHHLRQIGASLTNHTEGGEGWHGHRHSEESKRKIAAAHRGRTVSPETRQRLRERHLGKRLSEQHKRKLSLAGKGRIVPPEVRLCKSLQQRGKARPLTTGERNGRAKITATAANEIAHSALSVKELSLQFGLSKSQIARIKSGTHWKTAGITYGSTLSG